MNVYESLLTCGTKSVTPEMKERLRGNWIICHSANVLKMTSDNPAVPLAVVAYWLQTDDEFRRIFLSNDASRQFSAAVAEARSVFLTALKPSAQLVNMAKCFAYAHPAKITNDQLEVELAGEDDGEMEDGEDEDQDATHNEEPAF